MKRPLILLIFVMALLASSCASSKKEKVQLQQNAHQPTYNRIPSSSASSYSTYNDYHKDKNFIEKDILFYETSYRLDEDDLTDLNNSADPLTSLSAICYKRKYDEAFSYSDKIFEEYKTHPGYWNIIGNCFFMKGEIEKSRLYYNKSLDLEKNYAPALNNLGVIYQAEGRDQKAIVAFKMAKEKNAFSLTPTFNLAQIYLKYGVTQYACELYEILYSRNNKDQDVLSGQAVCKLKTASYNESLKYFEQIKDEVLTKKPDLMMNYALNLNFLGRKEDSMDMLKKIKKKNLNNLMDYYQRVSHFIEGH